MSRLLTRTLAVVGIAIAAYAIAVVAIGVAPLRAVLGGFAWWTLAAALGLSSVNYLLRFAKWELMLGWVDARAHASRPLGGLASLRIYLAGLSMSVTPGKVGEVLRSWLLFAEFGVEFSRTAPAVVADRLSDLSALVVLALLGLGAFPEYRLPVAVAGGLTVLGVALFGAPSRARAITRALGRVPGLAGLSGKLEPLLASAGHMLAPGRMLVLTALGVVGWGCECLGLWLILSGFADVTAALTTSAFMWSATTIVGALSLLPGGLGASEGSLAVLIARWIPGADQPVALAGTLLARASTLWWGELIGAVALVVCLRAGARGGGPPALAGLGAHGRGGLGSADSAPVERRGAAGGSAGSAVVHSPPR